MRHHTTGPIQPVRRIAPVAAIALHRMGAPARMMLATARQFYRRKLRERAKDKAGSDQA